MLLCYHWLTNASGISIVFFLFIINLFSTYFFFLPMSNHSKPEIRNTLNCCGSYANTGVKRVCTNSKSKLQSPKMELRRWQILAALCWEMASSLCFSDLRQNKNKTRVNVRQGFERQTKNLCRGFLFSIETLISISGPGMKVANCTKRALTCKRTALTSW